MHLRLGLILFLPTLAACSLLTGSSDYEFVEHSGAADDGAADSGTDASRDAATPDGSAPDAGPTSKAEPEDGGSEAGGDADAEATGIDVATLVEGLASLSCERFSRCETKRGSDVLQRLAPQVCHPEAVRRDLVEPTDEAVRDGSMRYDAVQADECLRAVEAERQAQRDHGWPDLDCELDPVPWVWEQCLDALDGTLSKGAICHETRSCSEGLACRGIETVCGGRCAPLEAEGGSCETHDDCQPHLACFEQVCELRRTSGGECSSDRECAKSRSSDFYCASGACTPRLVVNGACSPGESRLCGGSLLCVADQVGGTSRCSPQDEAAAFGEMCDAARPCSQGLRCSEGGLCVSISRPAASCTSDAQCPYGLWCENGSCQPLPAAGDACSSDAGATPCIEGICLDEQCQLAPAATPCEFDPGALFATCSGYCSEAGECANVGIVNRGCEADYQCPVPTLVCRLSDAPEPSLKCLAPQCDL